MNDKEAGRFIEPQEQTLVLDAVDFVATHPVMTSEFRDLWEHDPNTATHVMRVTLAMIHASQAIGLDSRFAAVCGITHDLQKRDVPAVFLRDPQPDAATLKEIREPHMKRLRETIYALPEEELSDSEKYMVLAVIMSHHEFLSSGNGRSPYPRRTTDGDPSKTPRKPPTDEIRSMQAILALSDTADRIAHGFHNTEIVEYKQVRDALAAIICSAHTHLSEIEQGVYADIVAASTLMITPALTQEAFRILGIDAAMT